MLVDARAERGISEQGNQIEFAKQHHKTLSPVAMSPLMGTNHYSMVTFKVDDY